MDEIWRTIPDTQGRYEISTEARVRNKQTGRILSQFIGRFGSVTVFLSGNGRSYTVVNLMAKTFLRCEAAKHRNGDITDNRLTNLEGKR